MTSTLTTAKPYREIRPDGTLVINMHPGQSRAWRSLARFPVILAGAQAGKTCFEPDWLHREIAMKGAGDYIVGTATFPLLDLKLLPEFTNLFCTVLKWGKYKDSDKIIESTRNHSRIIFFSAVNPESMESATAKAAVLDEAGMKQYKLATWEAVQRRLAINQGRCLTGTTLYGLGWLKTEVYDRAKAGDADFDIIQFDSTMNPAFPKEEYDRMKARMPAWKFDMFYRGRYSRPVGLVYDNFKEDAWKIKSFDIPKTWLIYSGHDFGSANPAATFWAQEPITGQLYLFYEYLPGIGRSIAQHVEEFKKITAGYTVVKRVGGSHQEEGIREGYASHGWPITEPKVHGAGSLEYQILKTYGIFSTDKVRVFEGMTHWLDEIMTFSHPLDDKYEPTNEFENEQDYHLLASTRYLLSDFVPDTVQRSNKPVVWSFR
jgi:hypothetical protein